MIWLALDGSLYTPDFYQINAYFSLASFKSCVVGFFKFMYLFMAVLGLHCCAWTFSSCGRWDSSLIAVHVLLIGVVSLEHGLQSMQASVVVTHGLSCSMACGIFTDQGSNSCPLHWQAYS